MKSTDSRFSAVALPRSWSIKAFEGEDAEARANNRDPYPITMSVFYIAKGVYHFGDLLSQIPLTKKEFDDIRSQLRSSLNVDVAMYDRGDKLLIDDVVNRKVYHLHRVDGQIVLEDLEDIGE